LIPKRFLTEEMNENLPKICSSFKEDRDTHQAISQNIPSEYNKLTLASQMFVLNVNVSMTNSMNHKRKTFESFE